MHFTTYTKVLLWDVEVWENVCSTMMSSARRPKTANLNLTPVAQTFLIQGSINDNWNDISLKLLTCNTFDVFIS